MKKQYDLLDRFVNALPSRGLPQFLRNKINDRKDKQAGYEGNSRKELFLKFKNGNFIQDEYELNALERNASVGHVSFGFNYRNGNSEAKLTDQGRWFVRQLDYSDQIS